MKLIKILFALIMCCFLWNCDGNTQNKNQEKITTSDPIEALKLNEDQSEAIAFAQSVVNDEYDKNALFLNEGFEIDSTLVPGRFKIQQSMIVRDNLTFKYRIWVQKFKDEWEYGLLEIKTGHGVTVLTKNGRMKEMEVLDGLGDRITAGGIEFTIAEKKPTAIRIYTKNKLNKAQMKAVFKDLKKMGYDNIQLATEERHERGEDYAAMAGNDYFNYDTGEMIFNGEFLK